MYLQYFYILRQITVTEKGIPSGLNEKGPFQRGLKKKNPPSFGYNCKRQQFWNCAF